MKRNWHWIELIGFDNTLPDYGVDAFLSRLAQQPVGISLLFSNLDFVNAFCADEQEFFLRPCDCSYDGHPFGEEHPRQAWTNVQLKGLIKTLQERDIKVVFSIFNYAVYHSDDGKTVTSSFANEHPELFNYNQNLQKSTTLNFAKTIRGGVVYGKYFAQKLKQVLDYYGFDGVQLADGISHSRPSIENGDFTDEIVSLFAAWLKNNGKKVPTILRAVGEDVEKYRARRKYILRNLYFEFVCFTNACYQQFYDYLYAIVDPKEYLILLNTFWTRDPFEAFYRYGVDYRTAYREGVYAFMIEDVSPNYPVLMKNDRGGVTPSMKDVKYSHYEFFTMQTFLKALLPQAKFVSLSAVRDTQEQWNAIHDTTNELTRAIYRRENCKIFHDGQWHNCSSAPFYCLSDGVPAHDWAFMHTLENRRAENVCGVLGYTYFYSRGAVQNEVKLYAKTRAYTAQKTVNELIKHGAQICGAVTPESVQGLSTPVLALFPEHYTQEEKQALLACKAPTVVISREEGVGQTLYRGNVVVSVLNAAFTLTDEQITALRCVDTIKRCNKTAENAHGGVWTSPLRYQEWNPLFVKRLSAILNEWAGVPKVVEETACECKITTFQTGENRYVMLVSNDEYWVSRPKIEFPKPLRGVKSRTKYAGYRVTVYGNSIFPKVAPRCMEIIEIETQN